MKSKGSETCPVCARNMFPGDVVCLRCEDRIRKVKPQLLSDYANRNITAPGAIQHATEMRHQITLCAIQLLPAFGRPAKGARP